MTTVATTVRLEDKLKTQAQALARDLGTDLTTLISVSLRKAVREGGIDLRQDTWSIDPKTEAELATLLKNLRTGKEPLETAPNAQTMIRKLRASCD